MIKLTFCLVRLPHLSRSEFQDYWFNTHGPLVKSVGEVLGIRRYVQMHSMPDEFSEPLRASRDAPAPFDGVAQLWYDSLEDLGARMQDEAARKASALLLEDEKKFIDHRRSPLWWGEEKPII
ncbi:MAG TPA: EthD domain-containing protein [Phenylobacterium sp.]|nr:EthD domain-containing protein [Phenylobacterium sp.]